MSTIPICTDPGHPYLCIFPNGIRYHLVRVPFAGFVLGVNPFICVTFVFSSLFLFLDDFMEILQKQQRPRFDSTGWIYAGH